MSIRKNGGAERAANIADDPARKLRASKTEVPGKGTGQVATEGKEPKPERSLLPLKKSGERLEVDEVRFWEEELRGLSEKHPTHFQALHNLVEGRREQVTDSQVRDLRRWAYLARDNSVLPDAEAVMRAAYRQTLDGSCLVDPLDIRTQTDAQTLEKAEDQIAEMRKQGYRQLRRRLFGDDKGSGNVR